MSRGEKPHGSEGGKGGVVLQFLCDTRRRLRGFQFDLAAHHTRARWPSRVRAVCSKETPAGVGRHEFRKRITSAGIAAPEVEVHPLWCLMCRKICGGNRPLVFLILLLWVLP